jgi:hypothetical protein
MSGMLVIIGNIPTGWINLCGREARIGREIGVGGVISPSKSHGVLDGDVATVNYR